MPDPEPLDHILEALKQAARIGDLAALRQFAPQLEAEMEALSTSDERRLMELRASAAEAAALLEAALKGVAAARAKLAEIRAVRAGAGTYGDDGQRRRLSLPIKDGKRL